MKHLRETFTLREWRCLKLVKDASELNWHDFLLNAAAEMAGIYSIYDKFVELEQK